VATSKRKGSPGGAPRRVDMGPVLNPTDTRAPLLVVELDIDPVTQRAPLPIDEPAASRTTRIVAASTIADGRRRRRGAGRYRAVPGGIRAARSRARLSPAQGRDGPATVRTRPAPSGLSTRILVRSRRGEGLVVTGAEATSTGFAGPVRARSTVRSARALFAARGPAARNARSKTVQSSVSFANDCSSSGSESSYRPCFHKVSPITR